MEFLHGEMLAQTFLRKTETLHKRALRTVHNKSHNSHTDPLFKQSGIMKISDLYQLEVVFFYA